MKRTIPTAALALVLALAACGDSTEPVVPTSIQLDQETITLQVDETATVTSRILDQNGNAFVTVPEGFEVSWSTSDGNIASVENGVITGVSEGTATVSAHAGDLPPASAEIEVQDARVASELSFDYDGDRSGSFEVATRFDPQLGPEDLNLAVAFHDAENGSQDVLAQWEREDGLVDWVWFWSLDSVALEDTVEVDGGFIAFGYSGATAEAVYLVTSGSITFSTVTDQRRIGTFELALEDEDGNELTITEGSFDAPVVPASAILSSQSSVAAQRP